MEPTVNPQIESSWKKILEKDFQSAYFQSLKNFLKEEKRHYSIYPPGPEIFNAFNLTPFNKVKVVIIGQDPYHGPGQAHGLCFSVKRHVPLPPSLKNIYKEIERDLHLKMGPDGDLTHWAEQGVFLLNATLTVRNGQAGSHQKKGWETFTDSVIRHLSQERSGLIFLLWGRFAQNKIPLIDPAKHVILKSAHPSPLSAHQGFLGCGHFSEVNHILASRGEQEIDWQVN